MNANQAEKYVQLKEKRSLLLNWRGNAIKNCANIRTLDALERLIAKNQAEIEAIEQRD